MPDQVDHDRSRPASGGDVESMDLQAPAIPMTPERAKTSLARCRAAITRAHLELAEAIRIADHLVGEDPPVGEVSDRAARALHLSRVEGLLDEIRRSVDDSQRPEPDADREQDRATNGHRKPMLPLEVDGEFPPLFERIVVSPGWGRIHLRRIREGRRLDQDVVIAELRSGTTKVLIRAPLPAVFLSWLAREGDVVSRGWRIARLLPTED
jgi:hypothetical protein